MSSREITITKHNSLIEASYKLTLNEQRLISACISKLDPRKPIPKNHVFEITAKEFSESYGINIKKAYKELEEASKDLYEQDIRTYDGKYRERFRWVYGVRYHDGEGKVTLGFSPWVIPYLTMLHERFTSYQLKQIAGLKSVYSIRLFEFLVQFKSTGKFLIDLDKFRERLGLTTEYKRFFDLKKVVIERAITELNKKSNLSINWKAIKGSSGKGIKQLEFIFREIEVVEG
jgi:plasmid replication initiation protein